MKSLFLTTNQLLYVIKQKHFLKKLFIGSVIAFLLGNLFGMVTKANEIPNQFVRFHIVANSDSDTDQKVKWMVREEIFKQIDFSSISSKETALDYFYKNKNRLETVANQILLENGFSYSATITVGKKSFPLKEYSDFVLPSGVYDAVCITLGEGKGENFFCVMYPSLCMIEGVTTSTTSNVELLHGILGEEASLITGNKKQIVCKFKIAELLQKIGF